VPQTLTLDQALKLAVAHHQAGRLGEAEALYRRVLRALPTQADALHLLGVVAHQRGQHEEALDLISRAIAVNATKAEFHINHGSALQALGRSDDAIASFRTAISLKPQHAEAHYNLGVALQAQDQLDQALAAYARAIAQRPAHAEAHSSSGLIHHAHGRYDEAIACWERALAFKPDHAAARLSRAATQLLLGRFAEGWDGLEWRFAAAGAGDPRARFAAPLWDGAPLDGKPILLYAEHGLGDTLQFIRYAPLVAARGGSVTVEVQKELQRLVRGLPGVTQLAAQGDALPPFAVQLPLMSLPRVFRTDLATIPGGIPYIHADPNLAAQWAERLGPRRGLRVGLSWAGSPSHRNDRNRSLPLSALAPLAAMPNVVFYALQKGPEAAQASAWPRAAPPVDLGPQIDDFADTAAIVANLDLVIAVDTSIVHLCGAMNRPAWCLLPFAPDWRWLLEREDSPWYPSLRLFRQHRRGDWADVVARVGAALTALASAR
jgi:Tfp pilus assembly protein PilF